MSKTKALSEFQIAEMKTMVTDGVQPQKIADHYKIGISTVHNYKNKFKKEGLVFSSVRGREAQGGIKSPATSLFNNNVQRNNSIVSKTNAQTNPQNQMLSGSTFVINGTSVNVSSEAKSVNINKTAQGGIIFEINI